MSRYRDLTTERLQRLAALVVQRRTALGWSMKTASEKAGIAYMTYQRIEHAVGVRPGTYAKLEKAFTLQPGSCRAVLDGAASVALEDGAELVEGGEAVSPPLSAEAAQHLVADAVLKATPQLTGHEIMALTSELLKGLRQRGVIPAADDS